MQEQTDWSNAEQAQEELTRYWRKAKDKRKLIDWKWFIYESFKTGNQWVKWDRGSQQIKQLSNAGVRVVVNLIKTAVRAVSNYITRNDPKWDVINVNIDQESVESARAQEKYLDYIFRVERMRLKSKAIISGALTKSMDGVQVYWDDHVERNGYIGDVRVERVDAWDMYFDSEAEHVEDCRYMIKTVKRTIDYLRRQEHYDQEAVERLIPDGADSASDFKTKLIQQKYGGDNNIEGDSITVKEGWVLDYNEENKPFMWIISLAGGGDEMIRHEQTDISEFPFEFFTTDVDTIGIYGDGWVKNLIPLNKVYNSVVSIITEFLNVMLKGRTREEKGAGLKRISNASGERIIHKRGYQVEFVNPPTMPSYPFNLLELLKGNFEDISSVHDAMMGRIPSGAKSGKALEALQAGDALSLTDLVQNYEDFMGRVGEKVLKLAAKHYTDARIINVIEKDKTRESLAVIGAEAENQPEQIQGVDVFTIGDVNEVVVRTGSALAHSQEARVELVKELYQLGLMQPEEVRAEIGLTSLPEGALMGRAALQAQQGMEGGLDEMDQLDDLEQQLQGAQTPEEVAALEQQAAAMGV